MNDARRNRTRLRQHLLGEVDCGPGLLRRVARAVEQRTSSGYLPAGSGWPYCANPKGSVIGGNTKVNEGDFAQSITELIAALLDFTRPDGSAAPQETQDALIGYLVKHRITDADYLLGRTILDDEGNSARKEDGLIEQTRTLVDSLLWPDPLPSENIERCLALIAYLQAWLNTECAHNFRPIGQADGIETLVCDKCQLGEPDPELADGGFVRRAVKHPEFPHARCEVCNGEVERKSDGRPRSTCSERCKKARQRKVA